MNSSDSDSSSSAASPSPQVSPHASAIRGEPSLERLISHFIAAKKSLTATQHVYRATELAASARSLIEETAVLNARNAYARRGVDEQLETLRSIRGAVVDAGEEAGEEFQQTIATLDRANDRLQATLASLKKVMVNRELQKPKREDRYRSQFLRGDDYDGREQDDYQLGDGDKQSTLYDFVDEANHEELLTSLRGLIDTFNDARGDLDDNIARFDESISNIAEAAQGRLSGSNPPSKITPYDEPPLPVPALFHDMESHAAEMATLLHSLVSHYDLCVSALKHTEGGGEAAREAVQAAELAKAEESLYGATVPEPMDDGERVEMLRVLENDSLEVEDVVGELKERGGEMEALYEQLEQRAQGARKSAAGIRRAVEVMHAVKEALPVYLDAVAGFKQSWANVQAAMDSKTQELVGLCGFYDQFWSGYKKLLREVDRRAAVEAQMAKVADKARRDLEALYEADREAREEFVEEVGGFLPGDIWPGLADRGSRWEVRQILAEDEDGGRQLAEG